MSSSYLKLSLLGEVSNKINSTLDLDELLTVIMGSAKRVLRAEASSLLLIDEESGNLLFNTAVGDKSAELMTQVVPMGRGFAGAVVADGQPILCNDVSRDPRHFKDIDQTIAFETRCLLAVPMKVKTRMVGVLEVLNPEGREGFDGKDLQLMTYLADQAAIAIDNREMVASLRERVRELTCLYDIAQTIARVDDDDRLFTSALARISAVMAVDRASFLFLDPASGKLRVRAAIGLDMDAAGDLLVDPDEGISGHVFRSGDPLLVRDIEKEPAFQGRRFAGYRTRSFLSVPILSHERVHGVLNVADRRDGRPFTIHDLRILSTIAGQIIEAHQSALRERDERQARDLQKELEIAAGIQRKMLPPPVYRAAAFEAAAMLCPAQAVGGDYYAFVEAGPERHGVAIVDVSGKGIPAALFLSMLRNHFLAAQRAATAPADVLRLVNEALVPDSEAGMFATMSYLLCDTHNRLLTFANAGHFPAWLLRRGAGRIEELTASGPPLGVRVDGRFEERAVFYEAGDLLFLYTDGVTEERLADGSEYGEERLQAFLLEHADLDPSALVRQVMDSLRARAKPGWTEEDDHTCVAVRLG